MPKDSNTTAPHAGETNSTALPDDGTTPGMAKPPKSDSGDHPGAGGAGAPKGSDDFGADVSPEERSRRERELSETGGGY